jgi:hypothetical protein
MSDIKHNIGDKAELEIKDLGEDGRWFRLVGSRTRENTIMTLTPNEWNKLRLALSPEIMPPANPLVRLGDRHYEFGHWTWWWKWRTVTRYYKGQSDVIIHIPKGKDAHDIVVEDHKKLLEELLGTVFSEPVLLLKGE